MDKEYTYNAIKKPYQQGKSSNYSSYFLGTYFYDEPTFLKWCQFNFPRIKSPVFWVNLFLSGPLARSWMINWRCPGPIERDHEIFFNMSNLFVTINYFNNLLLMREKKG